MPIDARIPMGFQPIQVEPPMNNLMRFMQLKGMQQEQADRAQRNRLQEMQAQQQERERANALAQQEARNRFLMDQSGAMGPAAPLNPAAAMAAGLNAQEIGALQGPKPPTPMVLGPGASIRDAISGRVIAEQPFKPEAPKVPEIGQLQAYRDTLPQGDPRRREVDALIGNMTRPPKAAASGVASPVQMAEAGGEDQLALSKRFGKPPAGFRWLPNGSMEPIPGGPADRKNTEAGIREARSRDAALAQADRVLGKVDQALQSTGLLTAGPAAVALNFPGTPARNLQSTLDTIKANLGFAELQAMRDASPTGGALGAIAVQELLALQATVASLDQTQSAAQLRTSLNQIRQHYMRWKDAVNRSREQQPTPPNPPAPPAPGNNPVVDWGSLK